MANTRIKIRRDDLIAKLQKTKTEQDAKFEASTKAYWAGIGQTAVTIKAALKALEKLNQSDLVDKVSSGYRGDTSINIGKIDIPNEPTLNTHELDKMIRVLEASCDETISVAVGDAYARYL